MKSRENAHQDLLKIFRSALQRVSGREAVKQALQGSRGECSIIAIGKAAEAMIQGVLDVPGRKIIDGLAISKTGHFSVLPNQCPSIRCVESAHPVPDERSLKAGKQLLEFLAGLPTDRPLLFLISGGASSLAEVLAEGVGLDQLQRVNQWLLANGLAIDEMNRVRKSISQIKGGGLIQHVGDRPVELLLISDVPGDDPTVVGSGMLVVDAPVRMPDSVPEWIRQLVASPKDIGSGVRTDIQPLIVANLALAQEAAAKAGAELGYPVHRHNAHLGGAVDVVGRRLALELEEGWPGLHVWGGEPVVHLPANPGLGGRNQHLALTVAEMIAGRRDILFLSGGTDGGDGPGEDAGAVVDGATLKRGEREGVELKACLKNADSGRFLAASGDLIHTGPTGTNVMDLMLGLKLS